MSDSLIVGTYDFSTILQLFDPGVPDATEYALDEWENNPSTRAWPYVTMHENVTRVITAQIHEDTEALARVELAAIVAACKPGAIVQWQPEGQANAVTTTVLHADVEVDARDNRVKGFAAAGIMSVVITMLTTPYWLGAEVEVTPTISGTPFTTTISDVPGDVPALTRVRYTHEQATSMLAIGLRSNAADGFDPIEDYSGEVDAIAYGGESTVAYHATATQTTLGTPTAIDVADNRGDYLTFARVKQEASDASTVHYRAVSTVTPEIGSAYNVYGQEVSPVTTASAGFDVLDLGVVQLPAGRVQPGVTGSAYGPQELFLSYTAGDTTSDVDSGNSPTQTFTVTKDAWISMVSIYISRVDTAGWLILDINEEFFAEYYVDSTGWLSLGFVMPTYAPGSVVTIQVRPTINATHNPKFDGAIKRNSTSTYADGVASDGGDWAFKVYQKPIINIGATVGTQVRSSVSSKDTFLDYVALVPTDEACVKVTTAAAADQGITVDYLSDSDVDHDIYLAGINGLDEPVTGISVMVNAEPYGGPFLLRPGDNTLVGVAATPVDELPGDPSLIVTYKPRYLVPFGS